MLTNGMGAALIIGGTPAHVAGLDLPSLAQRFQVAAPTFVSPGLQHGSHKAQAGSKLQVSWFDWSPNAELFAVSWSTADLLIRAVTIHAAADGS